MPERKLLCDDFSVRVINRVQLDESAAVASVPINGVKPRILGRVTGVFQNFVDLNENRRRYPKGIWESHLSDGHEFKTRLSERAVLGVLEHPDDGITRIGEVSHVVTDLHFCNESERAADPLLREGDMIGTYEVLDTSKGRDLWALHEAKVDFGVSSRGLGSTVDRQGESIVQDDYVCETFDVVFNPSVKRARPRVNESDSTQSPAPVPVPVPAPAAPVTESAPAKVNPPSTTPTNTMSAREKLRSIKAEAIQLTTIHRKGLKVSDRASLIERAENLLVSASGILTEDASLRPLVEGVGATLNKFITEMDDDSFPGEEAPPAPPAAEAPPAPPAPGEGEESNTSEEVQATLDGAAAKLRELGGEDPTVSELAADLEDLSVAVGADTEDVGIPEEELAPLPESTRRKVRAIGRKYSVLESQHNRLTKAAGGLLERHNKARKSLREGSEYKQAAREIATRYNKDMIALSTSLVKVRRPGLFEANAEELGKIKIYEKFEARLCELIEGKKPAAVPAAAPKPVTESQATPPKAGAPAPTPAPAPASTPTPPAPAAPLAESHDALRMVLGQRRPVKG